LADCDVGCTQPPTTEWRSPPSCVLSTRSEGHRLAGDRATRASPGRQASSRLSRHRKFDRDCFEVMLVRLVTGCSWEDAERLCGNKVSDTTVRERRDEWIAAGVFETISNEAISGYDRIIGLDLSDVAVDGSLHKSPCGGGERVRTRPIGPSSDGSGRSSQTRSGSLRLDRRRCQPQRLGPLGADARGRRATWAHRGDRDHLARPRVRLCGDASPPCRGEDR